MHSAEYCENVCISYTQVLFQRELASVCTFLAASCANVLEKSIINYRSLRCDTRSIAQWPNDRQLDKSIWKCLSVYQVNVASGDEARREPFGADQWSMLDVCACIHLPFLSIWGHVHVSLCGCVYER